MVFLKVSCSKCSAVPPNLWMHLNPPLSNSVFIATSLDFYLTCQYSFSVLQSSKLLFCPYWHLFFFCNTFVLLPLLFLLFQSLTMIFFLNQSYRYLSRYYSMMAYTFFAYSKHFLLSAIVITGHTIQSNAVKIIPIAFVHFIPSLLHLINQFLRVISSICFFSFYV